MARRKDRVAEEIRENRRKISRRLLEAERREGTCVPELRRMGREAMKWMRHEGAPCENRWQDVSELLV